MLFLEDYSFLRNEYETNHRASTGLLGNEEAPVENEYFGRKYSFLFFLFLKRILFQIQIARRNRDGWISDFTIF